MPSQQSITRRAAAQALLAVPTLVRAQPRKPNLVVILADDLGCGDVGCYGAGDLATPAIDALAARGARFTDGYVSAAVCSPSRAGLLTGRHQQRFGHEFNSGTAEREAQVGFGLRATEKIIPQYLKPAGYRTGMFGKWHLGRRPGYHPLERGFDEFFGFLGGATDYVTPKTPGGRTFRRGNATIPARRSDPILRGRTVVEEHRYLTDAFAQEAAAFVDRHHGQPFFLYLALNAVHNPLDATDEYWRRFPGIRNERRRMLAAMAAAMDAAVGTVTARLREHALERDTMVVFLSDNGSPVMSGAGSNGPLNGEKCTYFEGGIRVPFVAAWPGRIAGGTVYRRPVVSRDILPTFLRAAGIAPPAGLALDGVDLMPYLTGGDGGTPHDVLCWRAGNGRAIRMGKWKLVEFGKDYSRLYDLESDLGERNDLSAALPQVRDELRRTWRAWDREMAPPSWPARYREITVNGDRLAWEL